MAASDRPKTSGNAHRGLSSGPSPGQYAWYQVRLGELGNSELPWAEFGRTPVSSVGLVWAEGPLLFSPFFRRGASVFVLLTYGWCWLNGAGSYHSSAERIFCGSHTCQLRFVHTVISVVSHQLHFRSSLPLFPFFLPRAVSGPSTFPLYASNLFSICEVDYLFYLRQVP